MTRKLSADTVKKALRLPRWLGQLAERIRTTGRARGSTRGGGKLPSGKHCARGTTAAAP